jgi:hypothetical protein
MYSIKHSSYLKIPEVKVNISFGPEVQQLLGKLVLHLFEAQSNIVEAQSNIVETLSDVVEAQSNIVETLSDVVEAHSEVCNCFLQSFLFSQDRL